MHPGLGLLAIGGCWRKLHSATAGYSLKKILKQPTPSSKETFHSALFPVHRPTSQSTAMKPESLQRGYELWMPLGGCISRRSKKAVFPRKSEFRHPKRIANAEIRQGLAGVWGSDDATVARLSIAEELSFHRERPNRETHPPSARKASQRLSESPPRGWIPPVDTEDGSATGLPGNSLCESSRISFFPCFFPSIVRTSGLARDGRFH
jgi:hypothetical protein